MNDERMDQILRQALSPRIPDEELNLKIIRKMEDEQMKKKHVFRTAVVVAASVAVLGTVGFAASKAYHAFADRTDTYEYTVNIGMESEGESTISPMKLELTYVPEDLHYNEDGAYAGKYKTDPPTEDRGLTPTFMRMPEGGMEVAVDYTLDSKTWITASGNTAIFLERDKGWEQLWIAFTDTEYVAQLYVNGFTMDEVEKLADGATLVEAEELIPVWEAPEVDEVSVTEFELDEGTNVFVGDQFAYAYAEHTDITIDSLSVRDDFSGITTDCIGQDCDYTGLVSDDGMIHRTYQYIKSGNGKDELDLVVKEEEVTEKVVVLEMTVTNTGDTEETNMNFSPMLVKCDEDSMLPMDVFINEEYDYIAKSGEMYFGNEMFSFETNAAHTKNNLDSLQPGESAKVKVAFLIDEKLLPDAYIQLTPGISEKEKNMFLYLG